MQQLTIIAYCLCERIKALLICSQFTNVKQCPKPSGITTFLNRFQAPAYMWYKPLFIPATLRTFRFPDCCMFLRGVEGPYFLWLLLYIKLA